MSPFVYQILLGILCLDVTQSKAHSCDFYYDVQPGPTSKSCHLTNTTAYLELQCQVSSNLTSDFHINWHYSPLPPDNSTINSSISQLSLQYEYKSTRFLMDNTVVLSTLTLTGFNVTGNGFYWCSVSSTDSNILTPNPSRVVRIRHQNECHSNGNQENCDTEVIALYEPSNKSCGIRCADQDINVNIIEAQICPQTSTTGIITCLSTSQYVAAINSESDIPTKTVISVPESTISSTVNWTFSSKPTMTISNSNPANIWIAIGASISCAVLAFYFTAGVIIICVINHRKQGQYMLSGVTSPFDDIHMDTFTSDSMLQEKDSNKNRVSNILFETNVSYECTRTAISHSNDNIYETIQ